MSLGMRAIVAGGGVAGLAAATALRASGWSVHVLERAAEFGEVGAGIAITTNGMAALDAIGVGETIRSVGYRTPVTGYRNQDGARLLTLPTVDANWVHGVHRRVLHRALVESALAGGATLSPGATVTDIDTGDPHGRPATITWSDADGVHRDEANLVVAADGIDSALRTRVWPDHRPRYSGKSCWRAVLTDSDTARDGFGVAWGPGTEFGALRISESEVYWYGYFHSAAGLASGRDAESTAARQHFGTWYPEVRHIVNATPADRLLRHDVYHLAPPLPSYADGRLVVVGDAAHAMVPTMGQGANTALEDGVCVGLLVGGPTTAGTPLADAVAAFDRARRPRTQTIARMSLASGRMGADLSSPLLRRARDTALRLVPGGVLARQGTSLLQWEAPAAIRPRS